ncbi:MAG: hypothetical protein ABW088_15380 [Sedimenticola sp.]
MERISVAILIIFSLLCIADVSASGIKDRVCNNDEFIKCVGSSKAKCLNSYSQSENDCLKIYPIDTDAENNERFRVAKKYGECSIAVFIRSLGITENKFEECGKYLESTFTEYRKNAEKAQKLNEERLRELEETQFQ